MKTFTELTEGKQIMSGPLFKGIDKIAGKDDLRPIFMGAYVTEGKIVCTDAHQLVEIDLSFYNIDDQGKKDLENKFIETDILIELSKLKKDQTFFINKEGFHIVRSGSCKISRSYPIYDISDQGNYPKYKNIIPTEKKEICDFNINGQLLLNIQNVFRGVLKNKFINPGGDLKISTFGANQALLITNRKQTFTGLLMPMKCDF